MDLLSVEHICKTYGVHTALNDVSFCLQAGQITGLLGPNGAGKTSLIRIINQITVPDSGRILFNGQALERKHLKQIGYLPEERGLYRKMRVEEQLIYLARLRGLAHAELRPCIRLWLEKLDLYAWRHHLVEELSKGMQQKVQFIATVLHAPKLLILDEPFTGFDPVNTETIKQEIRQLARQGTTVLLSTHRMESVEELCQHVIMLHRARKVLDGATYQVRQQFRRHIYKLHLSKPVGQLPDGFRLLESNTSEAGFYTYLIQSNQTYPVRTLLVKLLEQAEILHFEEVLPSMKDIFIRLVQQSEQLGVGELS